jgi:hypothetical protein
MRTIGAIMFVVALSQTATAADWQYCLAPSNQERKVYLTGIFPTNGPRTVDSSFDKILLQKDLHHDVVQCPWADSQKKIMTMLQDAVTYNQRIGRNIVYINWEPRN